MLDKSVTLKYLSVSQFCMSMWSCFFLFRSFKNIMFFSAQYNALVCFLVSPTPTAIPTMTHRPEEDTFGVSVLFSPEIESTYMKYNEVSQEHMVKVLKTNPILNHLSFHSFSFSHCTAYLPAPLWLVFYNFLSTFVHLCAVIDWIQIIFSSEDFNRDSAQREKRGPRLFGGPNYGEKLFASNSFIPAV